MAQDVYQPCPCGSGKKLKFCCLDIADEMIRALRLHETNQPRMALQTIEKLREQHADLPWVYIGHASVLLGERRAPEAKVVLAELMSRHPDHPFGIALTATAALSADGYDRSKPALYRAFQRCGRSFPHVIAGLAMGITSLMMARRCFLSCRAHLALAMRLAPEKDKEEVFSRLMEFDNDGHIAYPLRSTHQLAEFSGPEESAKQARQAMMLAAIGCFESAARLFLRLAEEHPESWALWQNAGFCRAWAGDETSAAESLHKAASLLDDVAAAVELETIAQLLDLRVSDNAVKVECWEYKLSSVSKVLTLLEGKDRFAQVDLQVDPDELPPDQMLPAGVFELLDRPAGSGAPADIGSLPRVIGELTVLDANPDEEQPAKAILTSLEGEPFEQLRALCDEVLGSEVTESAASEAAREFESVAKDLVPLRMNWHFSDETKPAQRRNLVWQCWQHLVDDVWPNTQLSSLGGKTPQEAAKEAELKVRLLAAVYVLDSYCEEHDFVLDLDSVCQRLQIEPLQPLKLDETTSLNACSAMQLSRLPIAELDDDQLSATFNRALLIRHSRFLQDVLVEIVSRPACAERVDLDRVYNTLSDIAYRRFQRDEALEWLNKARERADSQENAFELKLRCDLRELTLRIEEPDAPETQSLLQRFSTYYIPKLPQIRESVEGLLAAHDIAPPWDAGPLAAAESTGPGGIWTPDSAAQQTPGQSLWIPGQD